MLYRNFKLFSSASMKTVNYTADDLFEINSAQLKFVGPSEFTEDITVKGKSFLKHIHKDGDNADTTAPL